MSKISVALWVVVILLIGGAFYLYAPESLRFWQGQTAAPITASQNVPKHEPINAKHQYKNGTHTVAGEVNMPTACYVLNTNSVIAESMPEQVTINFTATTGGDPCTQVITGERFKIDFKASGDAVIKATWNGQPVDLNLVPASSDEDLNNFELYIKG